MKAKSGILLFNMIVGAILGLILIGLPLGIIGLFIVSILDRLNASPDRIAKRPQQQAATFASEVGHSRGNRRGIIRSQRSAVATPSDERSKLVRTAELQGR